MRKRITFQLVVAIAVLVVLSRMAYNAFEAYHSFQSYYDDKEKSLRQAGELLITQDRDFPKEYEQIFLHLESNKIANLIDFYQIEDQGQIKFKTQNVSNLDPNIKPTEYVMRANGVSFIKLNLTKYQINLGFFRHNKTAYSYYLKEQGPSVLFDIVLLIVVIGIMVSFRLQILTTISRTLAQLTPKDLQTINHPSQEIRTIVNFLRAFIDQHFRSQEQKDIFRKNLADGILHELFTSRKKPPYAIQAVLVRFDMNNYTRVALQEKTETLTKILSVYFRKIKELRHRYGGLDYQFIGDEKVLYFKVTPENDQRTQILRSMAFIRDAFDLAKSMSSSVPLTFKAAIVPGELVFYELDESHYFTGKPLIESARYLSTISEKERSILSLPSNLKDQVAVLGVPSSLETIQLKGFDFPVEISYYDQIDNTYNAQKEPTLYLADSGLCQILKYLFVYVGTNNQEKFFEVFQKIRGVRTEEIGSEVRESFDKFFSTVIEKYKPQENDNRVLACSVALSWVFIPVGAESSILKDQLYLLIRHKDPRVASNALMASQRYEWNEGVIDKMLNSPSNRLRGDALVLLGRRGIDDKFFRYWKELIENNDPNFILSGLWAAQETFKFHRENNPTHLRSNPLVEDMTAKITKLKSHVKPQVVQRAEWALESTRE